MLTTNIKRSAAALAATAGLLAAAAPASHADSWGISQVGTVKAPVTSDSYTWGQGWPTYRSGLKADSNEVAVEGLKAGASEVQYETFTLVADAGKGDASNTQTREPAHTVTMLDYMGSPVVTY
jgi:hypothetical protein